MAKVEFYQRAKESLDYDPDTGELTWKIRPAQRVNVGDKAGGLTVYGYLQTRIKVNGVSKKIKNHKIAWFIVNGDVPEFLDHINCIRSDNRISNLRACTASDNAHNSRIPKNNTSGYKGVSWQEQRKKWQATIGLNNKYIHLGRFDSALEAHQAYCKAADKYHGEFKRYE